MKLENPTEPGALERNTLTPLDTISKFANKNYEHADKAMQKPIAETTAAVKAKVSEALSNIKNLNPVGIINWTRNAVAKTLSVGTSIPGKIASVPWSIASKAGTAAGGLATNIATIPLSVGRIAAGAVTTSLSMPQRALYEASGLFKKGGEKLETLNPFKIIEVIGAKVANAIDAKPKAA